MTNATVALHPSVTSHKKIDLAQVVDSLTDQVVVLPAIVHLLRRAPTATAEPHLRQGAQSPSSTPTLQAVQQLEEAAVEALLQLEQQTLTEGARRHHRDIGTTGSEVEIPIGAEGHAPRCRSPDLKTCQEMICLGGSQ